ncbi:MAG: NAD(P)/FAD-dependent oxidoreductase [Bacteroidetes bacterium]|nr:MAG: NAD(P)/FAD-dependent oxidoreductase [Bacteroidota bacterium]
MLHETENLIIGAGPAGLAMAGRFSRQNIPYILVEQREQITPAWYDHYERVHLHTVKQFSHLPFKPFPENFGTYVPRKDLLAYYEAYAQEMNIRPQFGQEIIRVWQEKGRWNALTRQGNTYLADRVIVCTGFNRRAVEPEWPGKAQFEGEIFHSRHYKNGKAWAGKKVLVVGMGNSGAEIAIDLHEHGAETALSVRGPVNVVLRDVFGRPTQTTAMLLRKLPNWLGDALGSFLSRVTVGDLSPYGLKRLDMAPAKQLRVYGKTPVIDVGTVALVRAGKIKVFPAIDHFEAREVAFTNGQKQAFDMVLLATGYRAAVEEFITDTSGIFNELGLPAANWSDAHPGLYFLGFDAYASGILHSIYLDSEKIIQHIMTRQANPVPSL